MFFIIAVIALGGIGYVFGGGQEQMTITNFEHCIKAGHPVMESYPRQCKIPNGKTFTEEK